MEKVVFAAIGFSKGRIKWFALPCCPAVDQPDDPSPSVTFEALADPPPTLILPKVLDGLTTFLFFAGNVNGELTQEEVSLAPFVVASAGAAVRQTVIGQNLEPQGGDRLLACEIQIEDVPLGDVSGGKDRSVFKHFKLGEIGFHGIRLKCAPGGGFRLFGLSPSGKGLIKVRIVFQELFDLVIDLLSRSDFCFV